MAQVSWAKVASKKLNPAAKGSQRIVVREDEYKIPEGKDVSYQS